MSGPVLDIAVVACIAIGTPLVMWACGLLP
jgi:hypothetical protein